MAASVRDDVVRPSDAGPPFLSPRPGVTYLVLALAVPAAFEGSGLAFRLA